MCAVCGCGEGEHGHEHRPARGASALVRAGMPARLLRVQHDVLSKNARVAERNRTWLSSRRVLALNLLSGPGAGKTTLLERTIRDLAGRHTLHVIQGDQATDRDAERIRKAGAPALQVNTGSGCHLDATMIARSLETWRELVPGSLLAIENVGNLVCPALFDLGEHAKVVIASVTEGEDKPIKYPHIFRASRLMIINKLDLLPHVSFDVDACVAFARQVNPDIEVLQISATTGQGLDAWYGWIDARMAAGARA
jgi:hydrogenase nickel incorporation protein HypB